MFRQSVMHFDCFQPILDKTYTSLVKKALKLSTNKAYHFPHYGVRHIVNKL